MIKHAVYIQQPPYKNYKDYQNYKGNTYKGKFSNPIKLKDGSGYLLKDNKIYWMGKDGKIEQGCRGDDEKSCESELYSD